MVNKKKVFGELRKWWEYEFVVLLWIIDKIRCKLNIVMFKDNVCWYI